MDRKALHISNPDEIRVALELMEPFGMASKSDDCIYSLAHSVAEYRRLHAEISAGERDNDGNAACGGAIYGNGGWHRYYLRLDGYIYFSSFHASESRVRDAEALGFRIN